ncbi:hypothetical protein ACHAWU_005859 [Discostella pseudostelligera]|uniref:Uncharacterized protein n=1 Tax=Discostella pseudostelligera TaxID=259834 RepID=A0ABD3N644_9STRA
MDANMNNPPPPALNPDYVDVDATQGRRADVEEYANPTNNATAAAAAASTTTGKSASQVGMAVVTETVTGLTKMASGAMRMARDIDEKHHVVDKSKSVVNSMASSARSVDEKHQVSAKTKKVANEALAKARDVNEKHHVTEKTMNAASHSVKQLALGAKFISKSIKSSTGSKDADSKKASLNLE